jgi:hypothetical protein
VVHQSTQQQSQSITIAMKIKPKYYVLFCFSFPIATDRCSSSFNVNSTLIVQDDEESSSSSESTSENASPTASTQLCARVVASHARTKRPSAAFASVRQTAAGHRRAIHGELSAQVG